MNRSELIYVAFRSLFNVFGIWLLLDPGLWEDVGSSVPRRKPDPLRSWDLVLRLSPAREGLLCLCIMEVGGMDFT